MMFERDILVRSLYTRTVCIDFFGNYTWDRYSENKLFLEPGTRYTIERNINRGIIVVMAKNVPISGTSKGIRIEFPNICGKLIKKAGDEEKKDLSDEEARIAENFPFRLKPLDIQLHYLINLLTVAFGNANKEGYYDTSVDITFKLTKEHKNIEFQILRCCNGCSKECHQRYIYEHAESILPPSLCVSFGYNDVASALAYYYGISNLDALKKFCQIRTTEKLNSDNAILSDDFDANDGVRRKEYEKRNLCGYCSIEEVDFKNKRG